MAKVLFIGSKRLGLECLRTIHAIAPGEIIGAMTFDDSSDGRSVLGDFRSFCESNSCELFVAGSKSQSEAFIEEVKPELCLVVGWYWLFGKSTIERVSRGCLGIHNSLLPRYRGGAPLVWAMINGDEEIGYSLFSLGDGMDDGAIWGQWSVTVGPEDYVADVMDRLEEKSRSFLAEHWLAILNGRITPKPQDHAAATFCALRTASDGRIDWQRPAATVYDFIRAQSAPYPGAYSLMNATQKLTIWRARPVDLRFFGRPGQVAQIRDDGVYVICGDNRPLLVQEVSLDEGSPSPASEVLRSLRLRLHG